ncbi:MAG: xanthine dehydrogenase small subunit [Pseudomonadota bacterium]
MTDVTDDTTAGVVRTEVRFLLNEAEVVLADAAPDDTLLDFLRLERGLTGSKEGCNEGDCGACTVLVGRLTDGHLRYQSVNSCICFIGALDGAHVVTIEYLTKSGRLHAVQQAMLAEHGSQCGFCTPGIVISLYQVWLENPRADRADIERALQGNLCRCTGYAPIVRAGLSMGSAEALSGDHLTADRQRIKTQLNTMNDGARVEIEHEGKRLVVPANRDDLATLLSVYPKATLIAGATDVGLWVTKEMQEISPAIFIGNLDEMKMIASEQEHLRIGASVTYSDSERALADHHSTLSALLHRIGGEQVRNQGTIGGNIANGSPIGDMPPPLISLGATLILMSKAGQRTIPLEDFFIDYGRQDLRKGEFVSEVVVPRLADDARFSIYKISKRRDEDISALLAAFMVRVGGDGMISDARISFGGMAGVPKRALSAEDALKGHPFNVESFAAAARHLPEDFTPLSDWRASKEYRMLAAQNLFRRFALEHLGEAVSVERNPIRYESEAAE